MEQQPIVAPSGDVITIQFYYVGEKPSIKYSILK